MPAGKPKGWDAFGDSIPFVSSGRKKTTPRSVKTSIKAANKAGKTFNSAASASAKYALGDPKKGWQDVALNTGMLIAPYGRGAKAINKGVNAVVKATKTAKVVRGAAKTGAVLAGESVFEKGLKATKKPKTTKHMVSGKKTKKK